MIDVVRRFILPLLLALTAAPVVAGSFVYGAKQGVAIGGYDPVTYFTLGKPQKGSARITFDWSGTTWRFASKEDRALFQAMPEHYAPEYGGYCAYAMTDGNLVAGDPKQWHVEAGKLYLNNNWFAKKLWMRDVPAHVHSGDEHWPAAKTEAEQEH